MSNLPPTPRSLQGAQSLNTLRGLMAIEKRSKENTFNYARSLLKSDTRVTYKRNGKEGVARILSVGDVPGHVRVYAERVTTLRKIELKLEDITGIVQEG